MDGKQKVLIHIGTHKTGTTSIQDTLRASSDLLLRNGILFPEAGCPPGLSGQHMLAWALRADKQHKLPSPAPCVWDELLHEIEAVRPKLAILSAESFSRMNRAEIKMVSKHLAGYSVSVALYLRHPMAYLKSAYSQQVKAGTCYRSFSEFVTQTIGDVNYKPIVQRWSEVFGMSNLHVRKFEAAVRSGSLIGDFAKVAGIEEGILLEQARSNVSPPDEVVQIVRYLNLVERTMAPLQQLTFSRRSLIERVRRRLLRGGFATWIPKFAGRSLQVHCAKLDMVSPQLKVFEDEYERACEK